MILVRLFLYILIAATLGCSTSGGVFAKGEVDIKLRDVEQLNIQTASRDRVLELFGKPDLSQVMKDNGTEEDVWLYLSGIPKTTRLSVIFDNKSGSIKSVNWFVKPGESEADTEKLLSRYSSEKMTAVYRTEMKGHTVSDKFFYSNPEGSFLIFVNRGSKAVSSVSWSSEGPSRKPSNTK